MVKKNWTSRHAGLSLDLSESLVVQFKVVLVVLVAMELW